MLVLSRVSWGSGMRGRIGRSGSDRRTIWGRSESLYQRLYGSGSRELLRSALPRPSAALPGLSGEKNTPTDLFEAGRLPIDSRCGGCPATVRGRRVCAAAAAVCAEGAALTTSKVGARSGVRVGAWSGAVAGGCSSLLAVPDASCSAIISKTSVRGQSRSSIDVSHVLSGGFAGRLRCVAAVHAYLRESSRTGWTAVWAPRAAESRSAAGCRDGTPPMCSSSQGPSRSHAACCGRPGRPGRWGARALSVARRPCR